MKIFPFRSSSEGNSTLITSGKTNILIDCGTSYKQIKEVTGMEAFDACLVTHEHTDHARSANLLWKKGTTIYAHAQSVKAKPEFFPSNFKELVAGHDFVIGSLSVFPFSLLHDVKKCLGFIISDKRISYGHLADTGNFTRMIVNFLKKCDVVFLECDYDPQGLKDCLDYDDFLKERIASDFGHLGNDQVHEFLKEHGKKFKRVILGHLSPRTNSPELVKTAMADVRDDILIAPLDKPLEV